MEGSTDHAAARGQQANGRSVTVEVDSSRLVRKDGVLGFEKSSGFEEMTNFDISVEGYVGDGGHVIGYFLSIEIAVSDPQADDTARSSQSVYMTNRELGNHQSIINVLTKFPALWISQSQKDPFLPNYIYRLCKDYVNGDNPRKFSPVKIIGKQPESEEWVFNVNTQMTVEGRLIPKDDQKYVLIEGDVKLPQLSNVTGDFDDGSALKALFEAEQQLFQNNFPQVIMAHAVSSIVANYDLVVEEFDGCSVPVLQGQPVSGKTTAMRAVLSVFGQTKFSCESTAKFLETKQASTTIPFGWDDADNMKTVRSIVVNSYNAGGSANTRKAYIPHTVPIITTNSDCDDIKTKSRWFRIKFERLDPQLKGIELEKAETALRKAMKEAHKSIWIVTAYVYTAIKGRQRDSFYQELVDEMEGACESLGVDIRAQRMYTLMLFCAKKILQAANSGDMYALVLEKTKNLILPSYSESACKGKNSNPAPSSGHGSSSVRQCLQETLPDVVLQAPEHKVLPFFDNMFSPSSCQCGSTIAFHPKMFLDFCKEQNRNTHGVTEAAIRSFIKQEKIGCTSNRIRFRGTGIQVSAVHIPRAWFDEDVIKKFDGRFGVRNQQRKKGSSTCTRTVNTEPEVVPVPVTEEQGSGIVDNTEPVVPAVPAVPVTEEQGSGVVETTEPVVPTVPFTEEQGSGIKQYSTEPTTVTVVEEQVQLIDEDDEELDAAVALVLEPLVNAESVSGVEDDAKDESEGIKKRRKGGKDQVSNLYDRLHPGNVSGKRRRTQRNPTAGTSS